MLLPRSLENIFSWREHTFSLWLLQYIFVTHIQQYANRRIITNYNDIRISYKNTIRESFKSVEKQKKLSLAYVFSFFWATICSLVDRKFVISRCINNVVVRNYEIFYNMLISNRNEIFRNLFMFNYMIISGADPENIEPGGATL